MQALLIALLASIQLTHRVTDLAHVMSAEDATALESELAQLEQTDSTQVALLTVRTTGGAPIEEFSLGVAEENQLGQKGRDNGVLVVVAMDDRRVRIEVDYGSAG